MTFSAGISLKKREGAFGVVRPKSIRCRAFVSVSFSLARVMAT